MLRPGVICLLLFGLTGCGFLENGPKEIADRIDRLALRLDADCWDDAAELMTSTFSYQSLDGVVAKDAQKPLGREAWKKSIAAVPHRVQLRFVVKELHKSKAGYVATVTVELETLETGGESRSFSWKILQAWIKDGGAWKLAGVKEQSKPEKQSIPEKQVTPTRPAQAATAASEVGQATDYATGSTQLKTKKKITNQIDQIQKTSGSPTPDQPNPSRQRRR